jgi:peptidoglycan-associated lipoprotein
MKTLNWKVIVTAAFCVFLTTACSKKLMPPEIETSADVSEETEVASSSVAPSENSFAGSGGPADSGFFSEEPILERGSSSDSSSVASSDTGSSSGSTGLASGNSGPGGLGGSGDNGFGSSGQANIGNGSSGSFSANPFASNDSGNVFGDGSRSGSGSGSGTGSGSDMGMNSGSSGSMGMGSGIQESRLQSFQATADLKDIHFKFDQYDLDDNSRAVLQKNATFLKNNPGLHVEVQGHCDERGTNNYNIALGERRAHSTKKYLVSQGVDSRKVHVISYGEEKPFCFGSGENCWQENRRAHFMVSK